MGKYLRHCLFTAAAALAAAMDCSGCSLSAESELSSAPVVEKVDIRPLMEADASAGIGAQCAQFLYELSGGREENCMFSPASLEDYEFTKADGTVIRCDALRMEDTGSMWYYDGDGFQAFSVDYKEDDGRYRFYGFLPDAEGERNQGGLGLDSLTEPDEKYQIYVNIPKFEFSSDMSCNSALYNAGLTDLFDEGRADFSEGFELSGGKNVYVSDVVQKTKIRFDEKGTEASAYTGIMMMTTALEAEIPSVYELEFNRPFLFLIWDNEENVPLFVGQVYDPSATF